jgi:hypothetical protein
MVSIALSFERSPLELESTTAMNTEPLLEPSSSLWYSPGKLNRHTDAKLLCKLLIKHRGLCIRLLKSARHICQRKMRNRAISSKSR